MTLLRGVSLLWQPSRGIDDLGITARPAARMVIAALGASLWPAAAVVVGNVLAGVLGHEESDVAARRAAVGLLCAVCGACVCAPALAMLTLRWTRAAGEIVDASRACGAATRIVLPAWACGVIAGLPPALGLGPEMGELLWAVLATVVAMLAVRGGVTSSLGIRRRWKLTFALKLSLGFGALFLAAVVLPAVGLRSLLGAATPLPLPQLEPAALPWPPPPTW